MIGPPEHAPSQQIALLRSVGYAAFGRHEKDLDVLDVVYDSLVDAPDSCDRRVRRLRFAGHGVTLDVDVRGRTDLTVELRVSPPGPVVVESRGDDTGRPKLVSFLLRWPSSTQQPVRTAWIIL
ncbi:hypothetical protein PWY87_00155 [Kribbella solani]|uniref:hypothetical protein n=1 Tax=Kribbella solani TaxID=236067 RepID=UPI0029B1D284|nr:hypothetical protein [Kribbella solani]MDX2970321.1 hypothetical protein [Kribbella solani]MDX3000060.1 hypothetical protein [Kribbella solani]